MMNRGWIALLLAWMLALGLCACQDKTEPAPSVEPTPTVAPTGTLVVELGPEDWEAELAACVVSGEETDYEVIAQQLTEQYAQVLRARPQNARQSVLDAQPKSLDKRVYDAYYGEEDPNFCFRMALYLDLAQERVTDWMVGTDLEEPDASNPYPAYWGWAREAAAEKGEDGNWRLTQINTGGTFVRLPVTFGHPGERPGLEEMMDAWLLTEGETHDWRILLFLDTEGYGADEVKAELDQWWSEAEREMMLEGVQAYMAQYGGSYNWKAGDWT